MSFVIAQMIVCACVAVAPAIASASTATFTFPLNGATSVKTNTPFSWTAVPGATYYYLYVGTTQGSDNLVDSYALNTTSYQAPELPSGQTLWARIWTDVGNTRTYQDISFTVAPLTTTYFSYPAAGAQSVDPTTPFSWYAVPGVTEYDLYIGTTEGGSTLLNSGALTTTSYTVPALPAGETLWARVWTDTNGSWTHTDISFQALPPSHSLFTYPLNGATNVSTAQSFAWDSVPSAQAYYLDIGTTQGSSNLLNSGGIPSSVTSYGVPALPTGETLWARLYTEVNGAWVYYQDISFQVSVSAARLSNPYAGQTNFDSRSAFTWAPAPDAQAYYLHVGTTPGASDVYTSGTIPVTRNAVTVPNLPIGEQLYARLYTEINGAWTIYTATPFVNAYAAASVTYPSPQTALTNMDMSLPVTWTSVPGATSYYVWIGSSQGASDVVNSGGLPSTQTSLQTGPLPVGQTLWLRVWTYINGAWLYEQDVPFTAAGMITAPAQQATAVNPANPFTWAPGATVNGVAARYDLMVGTSPGSNNLFDSGPISTDSYSVPSADLPAGEPLYARVQYTLGDGSQRRIDNVFAVQGTTVAPAQMNWGAGGSAAVDTSQPFQWSASPLDQAYRLQILNGANAIVSDSGAIQVPEYFDEALPVGSYTAQLGTEIAGAWQYTSAPFIVTNSGTSASNEVAAAHWATDYVRQMADLNNYAYGWTELYSDTAVNFPRTLETCGVYAWELVQILKQMNVAASLPAAEQPTIQDIYFINGGDGHVIVYFYDTAQSNWIVLDPTFDIAMQDTGSGAWATAQDAYQAAVSENWSAITYVPLGSYGWAVADGYYLDYPLLYLNIPPEPAAGATENDPTPYLTLQSSWPTNRTGLYILQATDGQPTTTVIVNGRTETLNTNLAEGFGTAFGATSVALPAGSTQTANLYSLDRYVFTGTGGPA